MPLLFKRIFATLLDALLFLLTSVGTALLFKYSGIEPTGSMVFAVNIAVSLMTPVFIWGNTIGNCICAFAYDSEGGLILRLLGKIGIFFFIANGAATSLFGLGKELLGRYTVILLPTTLGVRMSIGFMLVSGLLLIFTLGRVDFLDLILGIRIKNSPIYDKRKMLIIASFTFLFIVEIFGAVQYRIANEFNIDYLFSKLASSYSQGYYPRERFADYLEQGSLGVVQSDGKTYDAVSVSNPATVLHRHLVARRTISVLINEQTKHSISLRRDLVYSLLNYEPYSIMFSDDRVDELVFQLCYVEYHGFYSKKFIFKYYYDKNHPEYNVHGGLNRKQLLDYYQKVDASLVEQQLESYARNLGLTVTELKKYVLPDGTIRIPDSVSSRVIPHKRDFETTFVVPGLRAEIVPFELVEPTISVEASYPLEHVATVSPFDYSPSQDTVILSRDRSIFSGLTRNW